MRSSLTGRYVPLGIGILALLFWAWSAVTYHGGEKDRALYLLLAALLSATAAGASYAVYRKSLVQRRR